MTRRRVQRGMRAAIGLMAGVATVMAASGGAGAGTGETLIGEGPDFTYGSSAVAGATFTITAKAVGAEGTQLRLDVSGIEAPAGTGFGAHVHVSPCGATGGAAGPHYVEGDDTDGSTLQQRELWLDFSADGNGNARTVATRNWEIDSRSNRSVIVHALETDHETGVAGARLACIDLDG